MRTATIIRRLAAGTRARTATCFHSVRHSSFRTVRSQNWRDFHGYGMVNFSPSISFATSGSLLEKTRTARFHGTPSMLAESRYFLEISILEELKSQMQHYDRGGTTPDQSAKALAISINKQIVALGKDGQWNEILNLYQKQKKNFNAVNYATVMSQLARIREVRQDDPLFEQFLADLNAKLHELGIQWLGGVRPLSTIVYAVGKMGLLPERNSSAKQIMAFLEDRKTAEWLMENGNPQDVANCAWAWYTGNEGSEPFYIA
ncbi:hypothetical protein MHU86_21380 [Fragilaria crotonensis]|nr:hypothetical protein MHU86_21380 [Fragilaria crotonensis]